MSYHVKSSESSYHVISCHLISSHIIAPDSAPIVELPVQIAVGWHPSAFYTFSHALGHCLLGLVHVQVQGVLQDGPADGLSADIKGGEGAVLEDLGVRCILGAWEVDIVCPGLAWCRCAGKHGNPVTFVCCFWRDSRRRQRKLLLLEGLQLVLLHVHDPFLFRLPSTSSCPRPPTPSPCRPRGASAP